VSAKLPGLYRTTNSSESFTNQQFVILTEQQKQELAQKYYFEDEGDTQRFCTSWATTEDEVDMLVTDIEKL
jgi:threonine aldolase